MRSACPTLSRQLQTIVAELQEHPSRLRYLALQGIDFSESCAVCRELTDGSPRAWWHTDESQGRDRGSAYAPDFPGCVAAADTLEETEELIRGAIEFHIRGMREDGMEYRNL
jgi:hypothetical protein